MVAAEAPLQPSTWCCGQARPGEEAGEEGSSEYGPSPSSSSAGPEARAAPAPPGPPCTPRLHRHPRVKSESVSHSIVSNSLWPHELRTVPHQASLSMGFSRQEYWSGLPPENPLPLTEHFPSAHPSLIFTIAPGGCCYYSNFRIGRREAQNHHLPKSHDWSGSEQNCNPGLVSPRLALYHWESLFLKCRDKVKLKKADWHWGIFYMDRSLVIAMIPGSVLQIGRREQSEKGAWRHPDLWEAGAAWWGSVRSPEGRGAAIRIWTRLSPSSEESHEAHRAEISGPLGKETRRPQSACATENRRHQRGPGNFRAWSGGILSPPISRSMRSCNWQEEVINLQNYY